MTDLADLAARSREIVEELPADFVITEHPRGKFRWKGTYPMGWIKHNDRQYVEDYLFLIAAGERS